MTGYAVIGAGPWGKNHVRVAAETEKAELKIVCDTDREVLADIEKKYSIDTTTDYKKVLASPEVDAVSICVPAKVHYKLAKEALGADKHVLVEKPFTLNSKDAEELIKLAREKRKVLAVGQIFRFDPTIRKLKEEIRKGAFGKIYFISLARLGLKNPRGDVGVIFNYATHDFDIMCDVLEQEYPKEITAVTTHPLGREYEDLAILTARFNDTLGYSQVSWLTPKKVREFMLLGEKKSASVDSINFDMEIFDSGIIADYDSFNQFRLITKEGPSRKLSVEKKEPLQEELKHFLECIKTGKEPINSGEVGLRTIKMAEAAIESAKRKCTVELNEKGDMK
jgi:predicted dehydrogenase